MPISGSPKAKKNSTTVSGQLRITVTQAVPNQRSDGIGETRNDGDHGAEHQRADHAPQADAQGPEVTRPEQVEVLGHSLHGGSPHLGV